MSNMHTKLEPKIYALRNLPSARNKHMLVGMNWIRGNGKVSLSTGSSSQMPWFNS